MNRITPFFIFSFLPLFLFACEPKQIFMRSSAVTMGEGYEKQNLHVSQSVEDGTVIITKEMMESSTFTQAKNKPKVVIGKITNTTGNDEFPIHLIEDSMKSSMKTSSKMEVLPHGTLEFDYITNMVIEYAEKQNNLSGKTNLVGNNPVYKIRVQLLDYYGLLIGQWSAKMKEF